MLYAPAHMDGAEIEISIGAQERRTHAVVRSRHVDSRVLHAAVYPDLEPGEYTVWSGSGPPGRVTVNSGCVTNWRWPDA